MSTTGAWRHDAACRGKEPRHWFAVRIGSAYARSPMARTAEDPYAYGRSICAGCPVKADCLAYALDMGAAGQVDGLWGGLDEHERKGAARPSYEATTQAAGVRYHQRLQAAFPSRTGGVRRVPRGEPARLA